MPKPLVVFDLFPEPPRCFYQMSNDSPNKHPRLGWDLESHREHLFDYIKHITTLSTGSILLQLAFLEKVFSQPKLGGRRSFGYFCSKKPFYLAKRGYWRNQKTLAWAKGFRSRLKLWSARQSLRRCESVQAFDDSLFMRLFAPFPIQWGSGNLQIYS